MADGDGDGDARDDSGRPRRGGRSRFSRRAAWELAATEQEEGVVGMGSNGQSTLIEVYLYPFGMGFILYSPSGDRSFLFSSSCEPCCASFVPGVPSICVRTLSTSRFHTLQHCLRHHQIRRADEGRQCRWPQKVWSNHRPVGDQHPIYAQVAKIPGV